MTTFKKTIPERFLRIHKAFNSISKSKTLSSSLYFRDFNWSQFAAHDPKNKTENLTRAINANLTDEMADDAFDNLYPAIIQCFVVILFGYFAGRINLISHVQAKGLSAYTSNFALPALVFRSMVLLEFSAVDWKFLGSILIAKALVFVVVICFTLVLMRPRNIGKCGLYGIFATQSNDFALGYPISEYWEKTDEC